MTYTEIRSSNKVQGKDTVREKEESCQDATSRPFIHGVDIINACASGGRCHVARRRIRYPLSVPERRESARTPAIIAGPTCDSADTMYERNPVEMPVDLKAGDIVLVHDTGAYTATYSSVGFNGLSPLRVCLVEDINQMIFPKLQAI